MAFALCAWSFFGVEIPAVLATEATLKLGPRPDATKSREPANAALKSSVAWLPLITAVIYFLAGLFVTLDVKADDTSLPGPSWLKGRPQHRSEAGHNVTAPSLVSVFVLAAKEARTTWGLEGMFTGFFVITAWSAANTSLYVCSRTLYGLTAPLAPRPGQYRSDPRSRLSWTFGWLALTTDTAKVPFYAVVFSVVVFFWIPYLPLWSGDSAASLVTLAKTCLPFSLTLY